MTPWHETTKWPFRPKARPEMNANKTAEAESKVGQERTEEGDTRKGKGSRGKDVKDIFWLGSDKCLLVKTMK